MRADTIVGAKRRSARSVIAVAAGNRTEVPVDPEDGVTIGNVDGGPRLTVGLPMNGFTADATVVSGNAVYLARKKRGDVAVQPLSDGSVRVAVVIAGIASPHSYAFRLRLPHGVRPVLNDAGGVDLVRRHRSAGGIGRLLVGSLDAPWATDARGEAVPTRCTLAGNKVIQRIDFDATSAFPIVADPRIV